MKIIALFIWPIFFLVTFVLFKKEKLSPRSHTYSNLGSDHTYGRSFNIVLIVTGITQLIFLSTVLRNNFHEYGALGRLGLACLMVTTATGIVTGLITETNNQKIHVFAAVTGFAFSIIGYPLYGAYLLSSNVVVGVFMLSWGLVIMPLQVYRCLMGKGANAVNEFYMFLGAFLTNISLTILYL